jgi:hypothetical protein
MTTPPTNTAAARALAAQAQRLQQQVDARKQATADAQQTAFYQGQGEYSTLGADGGYRPRGNVTSGGVPIGGSVPANGGLVGGMPSAGDGDGDAIRALTERIAEVAQSSGPQIGIDNPNDAEAAPRYPQDHYYQDGPGVLWQWRSTAAAVAGEWIVVCGVVEAFPFRLDGQEDGTYVIDPYQDYPVLIESLNGVTGATVTVSPAVGSVAAVGSAISITVEGSESGTPVLGKLSLRRVG